MNTKQKLKGFTIIEVVLVLAIAGLIFLMVFIALPALQSGQRDSARKNDASIVASSVTSYTNNNRGKFPTESDLKTELGGNVAGDTFSKLSANTTSIKVNTSGVTNDTAVNGLEDGAIVVYKGAKCDTVSPSAATVDKGTARQLAIITILEGSSKTYYCLDS